MWEEYLFETRQGVVTAKRNLDAVRDRELALQEEREMAETIKRIRGNPEVYRSFRRVPAADQWLQGFKVDALRFPTLLVQGPSLIGKTEWAKSLFTRPLELKIGSLTHFPEKMRQFSRAEYDGVVLDDVRDLDFLAQHQHVLQGKYDERVEFATTPGGQCAYRRWLYRVPFVATINYSTAHLEYLRTHDWLSKPGNVVLVELLESPVQPHGHVPGAAAALPPMERPAPLQPNEVLRSWGAAELRRFLEGQDLQAIAATCYANGVNGADLDAWQDEATVEHELRVTPFAARKLLAARARFLAPP